MNTSFLQGNSVFFNAKAFNKNSLSLLLERKILYTNIHQFPVICDIVFYFKNLNISTSLYGGLIANFFFLKWFTKKQPFFLPVKIISSFKHKSYNFVCVVRLSKQEAVDIFFKNISMASHNVSSNDFGVYSQFITSDSITFFFKNFPHLRIVETHPVFFKWNGCLNITVNFSTKLTKIEQHLIFSVLKIRNKNLYIGAYSNK